MKASLDVQSIIVQVAKDSGGQLYRAAADRAQAVFDDAVIGMQKDFEEHPITQELDGGIAANNISQTLGGGTAPKNLYSFIGFKEGTNPTDAIRKRLDPNAAAGPKLKYRGKVSNAAKYNFEIVSPDLDTIYRMTPIPWAKGLSWAEKVETYIPGFANFIARFTPTKNSRSGGGLQTVNAVRSDSFTPRPYLSEVITKFQNRVDEYNKRGYRIRYRQ